MINLELTKEAITGHKIKISKFREVFILLCALCCYSRFSKAYGEHDTRKQTERNGKTERNGSRGEGKRN